MNFDSLKEQVTNLSLYDIKAGVRKVQNAVMNYTEMEAKVREATNNNPWGSSTTDMQEIANGTYNYQLLNEIMPMIYKRFTEKAADEWRQIYKALQLLEFLIKNGSERVIDDARSHLTLLKMLRQFHFIDANGKDQGINVRNRAKELTELLSDVERIRTERKKARATRQKYTGVEGGAGLGGGGGSSRFGGFGSEERGDYGGYSGGVFGDGGGFGGQQSGGDYEPSRAGGSGGGGGDRFEEYDEYDEDVASPSRRRPEPSRTTPRAGTERSTAKPKAAPPAPKAPEVDLFSFDEPSPVPGLGAVAPTSHALAAADDDDDFDDFQSAAPPPSAPATTSTTTPYTQFASPQPVSAPKQADLSTMMGVASLSPAPSSTSTPVNYSAFSIPAPAASSFGAPVQAMRPQPSQTTSYQSAQPNYFTSVKALGAASTSSAPLTASSARASTPSAAAAPAKKGGDAFGNLWNTASAGVKKSSAPAQGPALGQLAREKATQGIWGAGAPKAQSGNVGGGMWGEGEWRGSGLDDLLG
ncbi:epsin N-terminal y-containing protein [Pseudogymnoascus destructans]|uniref:Epsin N-terminal y-containing protein n=1 Tax=Pseudogymnoascus destructans TaxID=655981 RepID=A0A177AAM5_9PEZI|nr:epsin N-terminal y-containing protein [Pseudogymnoascus destructans]OAF58233.1 epsin N-terminal y-containing protein [Pseudogymnoascus destructans]